MGNPPARSVEPRIRLPADLGSKGMTDWSFRRCLCFHLNPFGGARRHSCERILVSLVILTRAMTSPDRKPGSCNNTRQGRRRLPGVASSDVGSVPFVVFDRRFVDEITEGVSNCQPRS